MVSDYLTAEQALGRVAATADVPTLAHALLGATHLLCTDGDSSPPGRAALGEVVLGVLRSAGD